jgi:dihydroorotase-like cyclic amidohydrolase
MNDEDIYQCMAHMKNIGAISMVHAENGEMVVAGQKKMLEMGITGPEGHLYSRPDYVEAEAVFYSIKYRYTEQLFWQK